MKSSFVSGILFLILAFVGQVLSAQTKSESVWALSVEKPIEDFSIPVTIVGGKWVAPPVFRVSNLEDLTSLPPKYQKNANALSEELSPLGVRSVADFSFLSGGVPIGSVAIRLMVFKDSQQCKAWWNKNYQFDGWEAKFKPINSFEKAVCVESKQRALRALAFGNIGITGQQHSRGNKTEYIAAIKSLMLDLMDVVKVKEVANVKSSPEESTSVTMESKSKSNAEQDKPATAKTPADKNSVADPKKEQPAAEKSADKKHDTNVGWNVFRGDALSSGVSPEKLPEDLEVYWEYKVPKGAFEGTALICKAEGTDDKTVYVGDLDGMLFAFDLETGKKKWEYKTPISFSASPAYRDGRIFIGDIDGIIYCVSSEGKELWKYETGGEISSSANFFKGHVLIGSQDGYLYLLEAATGKLVWKHQTPDQIRCSATVAGDRAFVAGCDGFLHVIDLNEGKEIGNVDIQSPTGSTPAAYGNSVFFGTEQAEFLAVDWKTIKGLWAFSDDKGQAAVRGCAAVNKDHVIFGARNRQVYSLNPVTGDQNWTVTLKAKVDSSPIIAGDRVYCGSTDGRFYILSLEDGKVIWEKQFNGGFLSSPAAAFGKLVIATDRGVVYCLGKKK
ncbi:MAG: PQQ-binding-like beta-propeller repeat protein [Mariniblastus sp.]